MRDICESVFGAAGIKLIIYFIKILYFNHSSTFMSNTFNSLGGLPRTDKAGP